jgi:CubicO group peptidase (beta-lactamase class C family)
MTATPSFPATTASIERELHQYGSAHGAQIAVTLRGERVLDLAAGDDGTGKPATSRSVFRVYCTIKPILATFIARLVEHGSVDLDEPLASRLGEVPVLTGGITWRHLLTHTAGLARPMAFEMEVVAPADRRHTIEQTSSAPGFQIGTDAAYSEYVAWNLLGWAVEVVTGEPLGPTLRSFLDDLGLRDTWIGMTPDEYRGQRDRIGVNHDRRGPNRPLPMLLERGERWCTEINPAHGGYTTATDLAAFYALLLAQLAGAEASALPEAETLRRFCSPARPAVYDLVLERSCPYGLGFMTPLGEHAFGDRPGPASFGHAGYAGASFAMADPAHGLTVAAIYNGIVEHQDAFQRRTDLLRGIYEDLGLARS